MRSYLIGLLLFSLLSPAQADDKKSTWEQDRAVFKDSQEKICVTIDALLARADGIELVSLDPFLPPYTPEERGDHVERFRVRKRAFIKDGRLVSQISAALQKSVTERVDSNFPKQGLQIFEMKCFEPQHAFRVLFQGKEVYILVCNICGNGAITNLGEGGLSFQLTKSWYEFIENLFVQSGLPSSSDVCLSRNEANQRLERHAPSRHAGCYAPVAPVGAVAHP